MQKIFTILRRGQTLHPEVLEGVAKQRPRCCLVPISLEREDIVEGKSTMELMQKNRADAWNNAKFLCQTDIFIPMDSDVKLREKDAIKAMIDTLKSNPKVDMVALPTKQSQMKDRKIKVHSVFAVWKDRLPKLKADGTPHGKINSERCPMCKAIEKAKLKVKVLYYKPQIEVKREVD